MVKLLTCLILFPFILQGQEYRLSYDPSTIPEVYHQTQVFLEQKINGQYQKIKKGYQLTTSEGILKGNKLYYNPSFIQASEGKLNFSLTINNQEKKLVLLLPFLQDIRFNLYTDSIKPILNFYVNVEGIYSSGRIFPLDEKQVSLSSNLGKMSGNEWIIPSKINFEKVIFTAQSKQDPQLRKTISVYLKKAKDPRDEINPVPYQPGFKAPTRRKNFKQELD